MADLLVRPIGREHAADLRLPNEEIRLFGRLVPSLENGVWTCREELFAPESVRTELYPDEHYDFDALSSDHLFVGAYDGEACVGLTVLKNDFFKYLYIEDIKVLSACRGRGAGRAMVEKAIALAKERGYRGVWAVAQDDNLAACRFYLSCGFAIGGFDNRVYAHTAQEGRANIHFYLEAK